MGLLCLVERMGGIGVFLPKNPSGCRPDRRLCGPPPRAGKILSGPVSEDQPPGVLDERGPEAAEVVAEDVSMARLRLVRQRD